MLCTIIIICTIELRVNSSTYVSRFGDNHGNLASYAKPGAWNDPDMLLIGDFGLSEEQSKTQVSRVKRIAYCVHYIVYTVHCTVFCVHCTVYIVLYSIHYTADCMFHVEYILYSIQYTLCTIQYTLYVQRIKRIATAQALCNTLYIL